jgi:hypothetical protein
MSKATQATMVVNRVGAEYLVSIQEPLAVIHGGEYAWRVRGIPDLRGKVFRHKREAKDAVWAWYVSRGLVISCG